MIKTVEKEKNTKDSETARERERRDVVKQREIPNQRKDYGKMTKEEKESKFNH